MSSKKPFKTSVGGQAVMEGVMMRGPSMWSLAVRTPTGDIACETHELKKRPWGNWPFLRGIFSFIDSIMLGTTTLMRSAELAIGEDEVEEPSKFDAFLERHFGEVGMKISMGIATVLGFALALVLFMFLPTFLTGLLDGVVALGAWKYWLEGLVKVLVFVIYLAAMRNIPDIRRLFGYHGAEHKTIACYEAGEELSIEAVAKHSRFHPRCGTSFLFLVVLISILVGSFVPWEDTFLRVVWKIALLPLVMSFAYELIRLAGRYDNFATRLISKPGLWLQRLTTEEPDEKMIEVAISAVQPVLPAKPEQAEW